MGDGGEFYPPSNGAAEGDRPANPGRKQSLEDIPPLDQVESLMRNRANTPNPFSRQHTSLDLDDYFVSHETLRLHASQLHIVPGH